MGAFRIVNFVTFLGYIKKPGIITLSLLAALVLWSEVR
jgi:hypothetical protein